MAAGFGGFDFGNEFWTDPDPEEIKGRSRRRRLVRKRSISSALRLLEDSDSFVSSLNSAIYVCSFDTPAGISRAE